MAIQQRFGSALNLNVHFDVIALDGVYVRGPDGELAGRWGWSHRSVRFV